MSNLLFQVHNSFERIYANQIRLRIDVPDKKLDHRTFHTDALSWLNEEVGNCDFIVLRSNAPNLENQEIPRDIRSISDFRFQIPDSVFATNLDLALRTGTGERPLCENAEWF
jgi:hypothetical protein